MRTLRALFRVAAVVAIPATLAAQQLPSRTLTKPELEYAEPFSTLIGLVELRDGRVVAADLKDKTLQAIDLKSGTASKIGREGAGPQEWAMVFGAYAWKADSILIDDAGNSRYLILAPDGKPVHTWNPVADAATEAATGGGRGDAASSRGGASGGAGRGSAGGRAGDGAPIISGKPGPIRIGGGFTRLRGADTRGRIYSQEASLVLTDDGNIVSADSAPIVRFDPSTNRRDTVGYVNLPKNAASGTARASGNQQNVSVRVGGSAPFAPQDDWVVFRDGTVAIVRAANYHVELITPAGRRIVGRPVTYTPVKVTELDKKQWRDAQKNRVGVTRIVGGDGGRGAPPPSALPPVEEPAAWPDTKPPFAVNSVFAAPNGELWVIRSRAANDYSATADVFSSQGQLIGKVIFPMNTRLVTLGPGGVYTTRIDADDLQYLQRYAMNWGSCTPELRESCK